MKRPLGVNRTSGPRRLWSRGARSPPMAEPTAGMGRLALDRGAPAPPSWRRGRHRRARFVSHRARLLFDRAPSAGVILLDLSGCREPPQPFPRRRAAGVDGVGQGDHAHTRVVFHRSDEPLLGGSRFGQFGAAGRLEAVSGLGLAWARSLRHRRSRIPTVRLRDIREPASHLHQHAVWPHEQGVERIAQRSELLPVHGRVPLFDCASATSPEAIATGRFPPRTSRRTTSRSRALMPVWRP